MLASMSDSLSDDSQLLVPLVEITCRDHNVPQQMAINQPTRLALHPLDTFSNSITDDRNVIEPKSECRAAVETMIIAFCLIAPDACARLPNLLNCGTHR